MNGFRLVPPARLVIALGSVAGLLVGVATVSLAEATVAEPGSQAADVPLEASHLPPLLTLPGEDVRLAYEAFCVATEAETGSDSCDVSGDVFVRPNGERSFTEIPLEIASSAAGRHLVAGVPEALAASPGGFEYYAVLESEASGGGLTVPAGGASAPHRSLRLEEYVAVDLGRHAFGTPRASDARVAAVSWGAGPTDAGLEEGRNLAPIGASAFDVDRGGAVYMLDEAHRRVLRWEKGAGAPSRIPVSISGTLADMAVAPDGSIYVLETVGTRGQTPLVRRFDPAGRELERAEVAERAASQIRMGVDGPAVLQQPSHQWMPVTADGSMADVRTQRRGGRVGRPLPAGGEAVVLRVRDEIRIAVTGRNGARRSWRLRSETPLAEVQLVEPLGSRVVVVARAYTDEKAEFAVLILDSRGLAERFSVSAADWAEAAPLGRFKLAGSSLYRLGSNAKGVFVDRFDLEVRR